MPTVRARPRPVEPQRPPPLLGSECEADIVEVLDGRDGWLTTMAIHELLEQRHRIHGLSTLKHTLALLVRFGVLESRHKRPYGYRLAR